MRNKKTEQVKSGHYGVIPEGFELVQNGEKIEEGDKFWSAGKWVVTKNSGCVVRFAMSYIRKKKKDGKMKKKHGEVPEGFELVPDGEVIEAGDRYWAWGRSEPGWYLTKSVGSRVGSGWVYIRKQKHGDIPEGFERVPDGEILKEGDKFWGYSDATYGWYDTYNIGAVVKSTQFYIRKKNVPLADQYYIVIHKQAGRKGDKKFYKTSLKSAAVLSRNKKRVVGFSRFLITSLLECEHYDMPDGVVPVGLKTTKNGHRKYKIHTCFEYEYSLWVVPGEAFSV